MNKNEVSKSEKILTIIGFVICFVVLVVLLTKGVKINANIEQNKHVTVGKIYKYINLKGRDSYGYIYYYKQIKYENNSYIGSGQGHNSEAKFYVLKLSTQYPEYSEIDLDQEVRDTSQIITAGFSKKDLGY